MAGAAAKRYARAVFDVAREQGQLDDWAERLAVIREVLSQPEVRRVLANPTIAARRRGEAAAAVLGDRAGPEGVNLAKLLVVSDRLDEIDAIIDEYTRLADEASGRVRATAVTAIPLPRADADKLGKDLSQRLGRNVRLEVRVDATIIGGLVLQIGDRVVDSSVATRLQQLRRRLAGAELNKGI
jgi:F-type H+-transporting ATPase subunit delta